MCAVLTPEAPLLESSAQDSPLLTLDCVVHPRHDGLNSNIVYLDQDHPYRREHTFFFDCVDGRVPIVPRDGPLFDSPLPTGHTGAQESLENRDHH
jgi:hypothetical protein